MKARARVIAGFVRFGNRRNRQHAATPAAFRGAEGTGAPAAGRAPKLALLALAALTLTLVLGVALAAATAPVVTVEDAANVQFTTADVEGTVNPEGQSTTWRFQYTPQAQFEAEGFENAATGPEGSTETSETLTGSLGALQPNTTYHLRLFAENGDVPSEAVAASTFTTKAVAAPAIANVQAAAEYTTATAEGDVELANADPAFNATTCRFEYLTQGEWEGNGNAFPEPEGAPSAGCDVEPAGAGTTAVAAQLSGLAPSTVYHLRLLAANQSGEPTRVEAAGTFATKAVAKPSLAGLAAGETHFSGMVNPGAPEAAPATDAVKAGFNTHWSFSCNPGCGFSGPSEGDLEADDSATEVSADPTGLEPHRTYDVTLHAANAGGEETETLLAAFTTTAVAPDVARETLWEPTPTAVQLNAQVNAHNSPLSDCHFEWGTTTAYGHTAACEAPFSYETYAAPADNSTHVVSARLSGLSPSTEYHFRLLATNSADTAEADDRSFTTLAAPAPESCPNQAHRAEQHSTQLGACRAWEMASPLDKGNGDLVGDGLTTVASSDGNAVAFNSRTPFGDTVGSGAAGQSQFLARRGEGGWATHAITPMSSPEALQTFFASTFLQIYSEDLRTAVVWAYDLPESSGDTPLRTNIYTLDTATRALQPVTVSQLDKPTFFDFRGVKTWGISADARHLSFVTRTRFLPNATPGVSNVYQWDDGTLSLAGILPDGTVPPGGSNLPYEKYRAEMSADGSRLLFTASPVANQQLYMRIDGQRTVWVSETELDPTDPAYQPDPAAVKLQAVTPDARNVFFTTETPLLPEDTNGSTDLYRYTDSADPSAEGNLTLISHAGDMGGGEVVGISDDGQRLYYQTTADKLVVWDHGVTRIISEHIPIKGNSIEQLGVTASQPGLGRVTPDGSYLAFAINISDSRDPLGNLTNGKEEMYVYSLANDTLKCVSCPAASATSGVSILPEVTKGSPQPNNVGFRPRFLSRRGQVFFSTGEALVPADTNGVADAYEYQLASGRLALLSSGKGSDPAEFADASTGGEDAFILTRQPLASNDTDRLVDVYDARAGSSLSPPPAPNSSPCQGEACKPPSAPAPGADQNGSAIPGLGSPHRPLRCKKAQHLVRRKGKLHCAKRHGRAANHDRRHAR